MHRKYAMKLIPTLKISYASNLGRHCRPPSAGKSPALMSKSETELKIGGIKMYKLTLLTWCNMWAVLHLNSTGGWEYVLKYADKETATKLYDELKED